eukprot:scaffold778_cov263-Pinguiococcus_pyrenoidosus.AAC.11
MATSGASGGWQLARRLLRPRQLIDSEKFRSFSYLHMNNFLGAIQYVLKRVSGKPFPAAANDVSTVCRKSTLCVCIYCYISILMNSRFAFCPSVTPVHRQNFSVRREKRACALFNYPIGRFPILKAADAGRRSTWQGHKGRGGLKGREIKAKAQGFKVRGRHKRQCGRVSARRAQNAVRGACV